MSLLFRLGTESETELIFRHLSPEARAALPDTRAAGDAMLATLTPELTA